jgi:hypothetical protein
MSYYEQALGADGICSPTDRTAYERAALELNKALQVALNNMASIKGLSKISVDGDIGEKTRGLYDAIENPDSWFGTSCQYLADNAAAITKKLNADYMDALAARKPAQTLPEGQVPGYGQVDTSKIGYGDKPTGPMAPTKPFDWTSPWVLGGAAVIVAIFIARRKQS